MPSSAARTRSATVSRQGQAEHRAAEPGESGQGPGAPDRCGIDQHRRRVRPGRRPGAASRRLSRRPLTPSAQSRTLVPFGLLAHSPHPGVLGCRVSASRARATSRIRGCDSGATTDSHVPAATRAPPSSVTPAPTAAHEPSQLPITSVAPARQAQLGGDPRPDPAERRGPGDDVRQHAAGRGRAGRCGRPTTCPPPGRRSGIRTRAPGRTVGRPVRRQRHQLVPAEEPPRP